MPRRFRMPGSPLSSASSVDDWTAEADSISLHRVDEAGGLARPSGIGVTYAEQEYAALAEEQELTWPTEGEKEARRFQMTARGLDRSVAATEVLLAEHEKEIHQAHADYQHAARVLSPYVRREPGNKLRYWLGWHALVLGDMAGVASAAIIHGDLPVLAVSMALASGVAAGSAGLVGAEVKHLRNARARQRDAELLTEDERRYARVFSGTPDTGLGLVGLVGVVSLVVVLLLAVGIFLLRGSVEGAASGMTFGCLAAATALASFLLGYSAADEIADVLYGMKQRVRQAETRYRRLAGDAAIRGRAEAVEEARSRHAEHQQRGQAAAKRVESLSWRVQRNNPQVYGHGFARHGNGSVASGPSGVIGRRVRTRHSGAQHTGRGHDAGGGAA